MADLGRFTDKLKEAPTAYTYRDLILLPGRSEVEPSDVDLSTWVTPHIKIPTPFIASPMDTVTGANMAIAIYRAGGIGVLHRNCSTEEQVAMVEKCLLENARFGAAVSPFDLDRAKKLEKYVDFLLVDVSHFHNSNVFSAAKKLMKEVGTEVVVGNVGTYEAVRDITNEMPHVAGIRVGIGSGSICSTIGVTRAGSPTAFATARAADALRIAESYIPIWSCGGIQGAGDVALALALGAHAVVIGNLFAGCDESPGDIWEQSDGTKYKSYRGMGSASARESRANDRYKSPKGVAEGVEGIVPYRGPVVKVVNELASGLRASLGYAGARNIAEMHGKARLAVITALGSGETNPHGLLKNESQV